MEDPYVWIDPYEEIARANRAASYAREEGERRVTNWIGNIAEDKLKDYIGLHVDRVAAYLAEKVVRPHMEKYRMEYAEYEHRAKREREAFYLIARPLVVHLINDSKVDARMSYPTEPSSPSYETVRIEYQTTKPFQYSIMMSPPREFLR